MGISATTAHTTPQPPFATCVPLGLQPNPHAIEQTQPTSQASWKRELHMCSQWFQYMLVKHADRDTTQCFCYTVDYLPCLMGSCAGCKPQIVTVQRNAHYANRVSPLTYTGENIGGGDLAGGNVFTPLPNTLHDLGGGLKCK